MIKNQQLISEHHDGRRYFVMSQHEKHNSYGVSSCVYHVFLKQDAPLSNSTYMNVHELPGELKRKLSSADAATDILLINGGYCAIHNNSLNAMRWAFKHGMKVIIRWAETSWVLGIISKSCPTELRELRKILAENECYHWACSSVVKQQIQLWLDQECDNVFVVPSTFSFHPLAATNNRPGPEQELKPIRFVGVGSGIDSTLYRKGIDIFCDIARELTSIDDRSCEYYWYGATEENIREQGIVIPDNCHFMGFVPNWQEELLSTDIFILSSRDEPWGVVAAEAMSFDLPVFYFSGVGTVDFAPFEFSSNTKGELMEKVINYWQHRHDYPDDYFRNKVKRYTPDHFRHCIFRLPPFCLENTQVIHKKWSHRISLKKRFPFNILASLRSRIRWS